MHVGELDHCGLITELNEYAGARGQRTELADTFTSLVERGDETGSRQRSHLKRDVLGDAGRMHEGLLWCWPKPADVARGRRGPLIRGSPRGPPSGWDRGHLVRVLGRRSGLALRELGDDCGAEGSRNSVVMVNQWR